MDIWEMTGLSPREAILMIASGFVLALVLGIRSFVRSAREDEERGLRLDDR